MIAALGTVTAALMFMLGAVISVSDPGEGQTLVIASFVIAVLSMAGRR